MNVIYSKYNFGMFNPTNIIKSIQMIDIGYHDHTKVAAFSNKPKKQYYPTFHIVLDGEGMLKYKNKTYNLSTGSVFYIPQHELHFYLPKPENPYKFVWIGVNGEELKSLLDKRGVSSNIPIIPIKNVKKMLALTTDFIEHNTQKNVTEEKMLSFFFAFVDTFKNTTEKEVLHVSKHIETIKTFINQNYMYPTFTIRSIADMTHISHSWLCALFKRETSMSMRDYLIDVRLNHAVALLLESDLPVNEISYMCGFFDALYFSALFKKHFTLSPLNYRKKHKKAN